MLSLVKELCLLNGVSSGEDEVRAFIREKAAPYAEAMRTDALQPHCIQKRGEGHRKQADADRPHG